MQQNITKNQVKEYLNNLHWINGYAKINSNDNLKLSIILGEPMAKKSKLDIILEKLDKLEIDVATLKQDITLIKQCSTIKKELELISNN